MEESKVRKHISCARIESIQLAGFSGQQIVAMNSPMFASRAREVRKVGENAKGLKSPLELLEDLKRDIGGDLAAARRFLASLLAKQQVSPENQRLAQIVSNLQSYVHAWEADVAFVEHRLYKARNEPAPLSEFLYPADMNARQGTHARSHHHKSRF